MLDEVERKMAVGRREGGLCRGLRGAGKPDVADERGWGDVVDGVLEDSLMQGLDPLRG